MSNFENNFPKVRKALEEAKGKAYAGVSSFVEAEAVVRCPVKSGATRDSIGTEIKQEEDTIILGAGTEYSPYIEYGTYKMDSQAFITPAIEENLKRIEALYSELLKI